MTPPICAGAMQVTDYFAEMYVAGRFAEAGWSVYFPRRDQGFDFLATKDVGAGFPLIRPVQVKGKYPSPTKGDHVLYGYVGKLTQLHPEMVLAIPFFSAGSPGTPVGVAYMPRVQIRATARGFRCQPASFREGQPRPRPAFRSFFDAPGLRWLECPTWKDAQPASRT
jgi:hypothetical protein